MKIGVIEINLYLNKSKNNYKKLYIKIIESEIKITQKEIEESKKNMKNIEKIIFILNSLS